MLCPSCRRQLDRGAGFCLGCGTPAAGARRAAGARAGRPDAGAGRDRDDDRPGARARRWCSTTRRSRACTRGSRATAAGTAVLEDAGSSHGTWVDGARITAPIELRDGIKLRLGDQELLRRAPARRRRRRAARSWCARARAWSSRRWARPGVTSQATQFGMRPRVRSGLRAQAARGGGGQQALGAARPRQRHVPAPERQRRAAVRAARRHPLAGRPDRRRGAALRRAPARRGSRGCSPTSASAASWPASRRRPRPAAGGAAGPARSGSSRRARRRSRGVGPFFERLYRAGGWVLFTTPGADRDRGADRWPGSASSPT